MGSIDTFKKFVKNRYIYRTVIDKVFDFQNKSNDTLNKENFGKVLLNFKLIEDLYE